MPSPHRQPDGDGPKNPGLLGGLHLLGELGRNTAERMEAGMYSKQNQPSSCLALGISLAVLGRQGRLAPCPKATECRLLCQGMCCHQEATGSIELRARVTRCLGSKVLLCDKAKTRFSLSRLGALAQGVPKVLPNSESVPTSIALHSMGERDSAQAVPEVHIRPGMGSSWN